MIRISQIKIPVGEDRDEILRDRVCRILKIPGQALGKLEIVRRSIDARKKPELFYIYTVDVEVSKEDSLLKKASGQKHGQVQISRTERTEYRFPEGKEGSLKKRIIIVGMGPAGLFCGYFLAKNGFLPLILERGKCVEERTADVERFWETGILDRESNVQFGEGGAGTFSDGKLNTLVKDKYGRNRAVLETFVRFGADERILYDAKPHIGTDALVGIIRNMRNEIIRLGGTVRFLSQVTDIGLEKGRVCGVTVNGTEQISCDALVLAVGHSARDTFFMLQKKGIPMEAKPFAVGLRIQHPQKMINESQYGAGYPEGLGAAPYKLTASTSMGRGVYSFCMCPGGYVVNASSEDGLTCVNGMSYQDRGGENANSAIIVSVTPDDYPGEGPLSGMEFQRELERRAFLCGKGKIPMQRYGDFKESVERRLCAEEGIRKNAEDETGIKTEIETETGIGIGKEMAKGSRSKKDTEDDCMAAGFQGRNAADSPEDHEKEEVTVQCRGDYAWVDLSGILPGVCNAAFLEGMESFGRQIRGFDRPDAILAGVESRTSSAVRILRDDTLQSTVKGLYPCGEGAGYAGGITSAAMDGIKVAEMIAAGQSFGNRPVDQTGE